MMPVALWDGIKAPKLPTCREDEKSASLASAAEYSSRRTAEPAGHRSVRAAEAHTIRTI